MKTEDVKSGFTMVELSIAMAFISVLLIAVATITTNLVTIYQKGLTVKAVNSVGRNLTDEFITAINTAPSVDIISLCHTLAGRDAESIKSCQNDRAFKYIFHASASDAGDQYNGIFCTGYYSYIWNTYYSETTDNHSIRLKYALDSGTGAAPRIVEPDPTVTAPRLLRVLDKTYRVCSAVVDSNYVSKFESNMTIDITKLANSDAMNPVPEPTEGFLNEFDLDLTLYELTIFPTSQDAVTLRTFMSGTFVLATLRGNVDIKRTGDYCRLGGIEEDGSTDTGNINSLGSEFNYCAINKFNFAARTAGV